MENSIYFDSNQNPKGIHSCTTNHIKISNIGWWHSETRRLLSSRSMKWNMWTNAFSHWWCRREPINGY